ERVAEKVTELLRQSEDPARAARLRRIRDQLNSAAISTFHSFCARVLREFPVQAGLPPEFTEMDEIRSYILRQEAIDRAIQSLDDDDSQNWIALFSHLSLFRVTNMLNVALEESYEMEKVERLFSDLSKETFLNFLHQQWFRLIEPYLAQLDRNDFDRLVDRVVSMIPPDWQWHKEKAQKVFERLKTYRESRAQPPDSPQALTALMEVVSVLTTQKNGFAYKNLAYLGAAKSWPAACKNPLVALSELSAAVAAPLVSRGLLFGLTPKDDEWYEVFNIFLALYRKTAAIYRQLKQSESGVDFNDLQLLTLKLLESHDEIRRELSRRFDYIMVDEFQDTDELQWQIVKKIAGDARDKLFVVGDPKQSIYGFRNADIRVFKKVKQEFARQAGVNELKDYDGNVVFTESFRFLPLVNRFVNRVFSRILTEEEADPYRVGYHALETRRDLPGKGHVEVTVLDETQREAEYVAWQIERLIAERQTCYEWQGQEVERPLEYGDMAILLRRRNELLEVEQALRDRGIPFKTAGGIGFWQRQEIYDIYHLLRFIQNPQDDFALLAVLRAGFFVLSDEWLFFLADQPGSHYLDKMRHALQESPPWLEAAARQELTAAYELLNRWRKLYDRIPLEDLLRDVMAESHYTDILASQLNGEQAVANVEKLILQAHHFDETGSGGLAGFLSHLTDLIEEEMREGEAQVAIEDRTTVKIMTIHGAKGLQFPVVFLPFLNTKVGGKSTGVHMDGELGMAAAFESAHDEKQDALLLRLLKDRQRRKDLAEARRLFYVGVTRASNYLFLSAQLEQEKSPPE
ncbi:MAG TPA: hypothetical protein ENJ89_01655, partial [Caldithrix abyssi]|nr:hypothetical protein [Caldithrix abyssi]